MTDEATRPTPSESSARRPTERAPIAVGQVILAVSALAAVVGMFLPWVDVADPLGFTESASDVPVAYLYDLDTRSGTSILVLLVPIAAVLVLSACMRNMRGFGIGAGIAAIAVGVLFAVQSQRRIDRLPAEADLDLTSYLGTGVYVTIGAGVLAIIGALALPWGKPSTPTHPAPPASADG
jgi:hypothetical protein